MGEKLAMSDMKRVGAQITRARKAKGLERSDLARISGLSILTIRQVERGGGGRPSTLRKIVEAINAAPWMTLMGVYDKGQGHWKYGPAPPERSGGS